MRVTTSMVMPACALPYYLPYKMIWEIQRYVTHARTHTRKRTYNTAINAHAHTHQKPLQISCRSIASILLYRLIVRSIRPNNLAYRSILPANQAGDACHPP